MTNDQIENFLLQKKLDKSPVQINFKTRNSIVGIFIQTADYGELKTKNLWRIVGESHIEEYKKSNDMNLARIFNGVEFTRLVYSNPAK
ncbi:MAG: short-chain dehydrogenase [Chitinophagaceae bacterium]|nr:short-chain dehydrogenase [Chitinophagaceae bacterium]